VQREILKEAAMHGIIQIFTEDEMGGIHEAALKILETTGVKIENENLLKLIERRGGKISWSRERAYIPARLVKELFHPEPGKGKITRDIRSRETGGPYWTGGVQPQYLDWKTGERRHGTRQLLVQIIRALEGMEEVGRIGAPITTKDVEPEIEPIESLALLMKYTRSPGYVEVIYSEDVKYLVDLVLAYTGKQDYTNFIGASNFLVSPLVMGSRCASCIIEKTKYKIHGVAGTMPVSGATSPVTRTGTMALAIAEVLSSWVVYRLLDPDLALSAIVSSGSLDMRTGRALFGSPEAVIQDCGVSQVIRYFYNMSASTALNYVDGKQPGIQATFDKLFKSMATGCFNGAFGAEAGFLDAGKVWSPIQFILDWDISDAIRALLHKEDVNEENLALDVIDEVVAGNTRTFLDSEHTLRHFRKSIWEPRWWDRSDWQGADKEGCRDRELLEQVRQRWEEAVKNPSTYELDKDRQKEIDKIVARARKDLLGR